MASFAGLLATDLREVVDLAEHPEALSTGWWAVVATFEGVLTGYRFGRIQPAVPAAAPAPPGASGAPVGTDRTAQTPIDWKGPDLASWRSSLSRDEYLRGVRAIIGRIAAGEVYQVNLCRMLSAPLSATADPWALGARLARRNPAPYQGILDTGEQWVVTASPELFLSRSGDVVTSAPVKGTARPGEPFLEKDFPENVMITDLVRNDLGIVARAGSVVVTGLLARQEHPGLAHLVSTVQGQLRPDVDWKQLLAATFPPGSVSGAPKHTALQVISDLEPVPRGPYCGAIGYVDADRGGAVLAVGIRTFFTTGSGTDRRLNFGTGAGITSGSDPMTEWQETQLKAQRLVELASR